MAIATARSICEAHFGYQLPLRLWRLLTVSMSNGLGLLKIETVVGR